MNVRACITTSPVVAQPLNRLREALALMSRHGLRRLPVVEPDQTFVGIVSDHALRAAIAADGDDVLGRGVLAVTEVGTPTLCGDEPVEVARALLSRSPGYDPLPVVTDGKLEGTVSRRDLLRASTGRTPQAEMAPR